MRTNHPENDMSGIIALNHKSCSATAMQCLADMGVASWKEAFGRLVDTAKYMGLMPDDFKVLRATLQDLGFRMQSTHLERIKLTEVRAALAVLDSPACVLIQVSDYRHWGGMMLAFRTDGNCMQLISTIPEPDYLLCHLSIHVWIRWDDGLDRSPFPRKIVKRSVRTGNLKARKYAETDCYKPFQPNPRRNSIGDCVVRGISGVLDISWTQAMDKLATLNETTVNDLEVYPQILKQAGFVHYEPIVRDGHRLNGKAFCSEMDRIYHSGERIFAHVGQRHVAAIVPIEDGHGGKRYKIIDSWDSSKRKIGDYWVLPPEKQPAALRLERQNQDSATAEIKNTNSGANEK